MKESASEVRVEILRFFAANPYTIDTVEGISTKIGYGDSVVSAELERLVRIGILRVDDSSGKPVYSYVKPSVPSAKDKPYGEKGKD